MWVLNDVDHYGSKIIRFLHVECVNMNDTYVKIVCSYIVRTIHKDFMQHTAKLSRLHVGFPLKIK